MKKVDTFLLSSAEDKFRYEALLNDPDIEITKEAFAYTNRGEPKITVWYEEEEDF